MQSRIPVIKPGEINPRDTDENIWESALIKVTKATTTKILIFKTDTLFKKTIVANKGINVATIKAVPKIDDTASESLAIRSLINFGPNFTIKPIFELKTSHSSKLWIANTIGNNPKSRL